MGFDVVFSEDEAFEGYFKDYYASPTNYENLKNLPSLNSQTIIGDLDAIDYGFGTVYTYDVGNDPGTVPIIGQDGKLNSTIIPDIDVTTVFNASSESEMLALDAKNGDFCLRSDINKTFILKQTPATILSNWTELLFLAPVSSVNGETGTVVLTNSDVNALSSDTAYISNASVNGNILTVTNSDGNSFSSGDTTYNNATTTISGLMSSIDKTKLDGIESGAQVNTVSSVNSKTGAVNLTYTDVNALSNTTALTDLSGTLAILHGGTGATTANEALTNLGAQASTDNSLTTTSKTVTGAINELHSTIGTLNDSLEATLNGV